MANAKLDDHWFTQLEPLISELFLVLGPPAADINRYRQQFEDKRFNPDLRPNHLDQKAIHSSNIKLERLAADIGTDETNPYIAQVYAQKINELHLQNDLLLASLSGDYESFMAANRDLYGSPDAQNFSAVCDWIRHTATGSISGNNMELCHAAEAVLQSVPDAGGDRQAIIPKDTLFSAIRRLHYQPGGYFEMLFGNQTLPDFIEPAVGDLIVKQVITSIGSDYSLEVSSDELWGVVHEEHQVVRPAAYHLSREEFVGIVAHEIGSHLLEKVNGDKQPLRLLAAGLDKYESSNEGRAFLREQIVYTSPQAMLDQPAWEYIVLLYYAAALGAGLYRQAYSFVQLYEALLAICFFFQIRRQPDNSIFADLRARDEAWNLAVRVMKGTDGQAGAYLKALVYLDGNVGAWHVASQQPELILLGDYGKFDITRPDHLMVLRELDILPKPAKTD